MIGLLSGRGRERVFRWSQQPACDTDDIFASGLRKLLANTIEATALRFVQTSPDVAHRLEIFRSQTLAAFDPVDPEQISAETAMDSIMNMESLMPGHESLQIPDTPVVLSRAGLYIYLNAVVRSPARAPWWICSCQSALAELLSPDPSLINSRSSSDGLS